VFFRRHLLLLTSAVGAEDATASLRKKFFGQDWLDLGKFGWVWTKFEQNYIEIWEKLRRNLDKFD